MNTYLQYILVSRIDWALLDQQRLVLADTLRLQLDRLDDQLSDEQLEALTGILHMLDELTDAAELTGMLQRKRPDGKDA